MIARIMTAAGCFALSTFSIWLAVLSYRYVNRPVFNLATPRHVRHPGAADCLVIFDGDSLTAGYGLPSEAETYPAKTMAGAGLDCTWENIAVSGAFARTDLALSAATLASYPPARGPRIYILWIGGNDLMYRPEPVTEVASEIESFAMEVSRRGWTVAVATATPRVEARPIDEAIKMFVADFFRPSSFERKRILFNDLIRKQTSRDGVQMIDFGADPEISSPASKYYMQDRTHLSSLGINALSRKAASVLGALLSKKN